jgi:hypothetical protein
LATGPNGQPRASDEFLIWLGAAPEYLTYDGATTIACEVFLAVGLALEPRGPSRAATMAFLSLGAAALAIVTSSDKPVPCGCLGGLHVLASNRAEAILSVGCNLLFVGILAIGLPTRPA